MDALCGNGWSLMKWTLDALRAWMGSDLNAAPATAAAAAAPAAAAAAAAAPAIAAAAMARFTRVTGNRGHIMLYAKISVLFAQ